MDTGKKAYIGLRIRDSSEVNVFVETRGPRYQLPNVGNHAATFEWGYGGSGPADLAWSILADHLGDAVKAEQWHQQFKSEVIAHLSQDNGFHLSVEYVEQWCRGKRRETTAFAVAVDDDTSAVLTKSGKAVDPRTLNESERLEAIAVLLDKVNELQSEAETLHYEILEMGERD